MEAAIEKKVWTEEELMSFPDDGNKYELVDGALVMSPTGVEHGDIGVRLIIELGGYVRQRKLGIVCDSSTGFWMKSGNSRSPDVSFISKDRLRGLKHAPKGFFKGAPDLAVEILSPNDIVEGLHEKMIEYFESGTKSAWVINPSEQAVLVYHSPQPDKLLRSDDKLSGEKIVPGFSMGVGELFEELEF